jgi:hypothetical protein
VIADSIAASTVEILQAGEVNPEQLAGVDLLVVGSPTRGFRPTEAVAGLLNQFRSKASTGSRSPHSTPDSRPTSSIPQECGFW